MRTRKKKDKDDDEKEYKCKSVVVSDKLEFIASNSVLEPFFLLPRPSFHQFFINILNRL